MPRSGLIRRRWTRSGRGRAIGRCCQPGNEKGILPGRGYDCVDEGGMDEVDETARRRARERLADDAHVAALLAAGDPAAERAALALAINADSWSRALVGLSQAVLHLERHVARGVGHRVRLVKDDDAVEPAPEPVHDLLQPARLAVPLLRAQRRIGREHDAFAEGDRRTLPKTGERHDLEPLLAERRPVALGILDQLVGFRHPQGPAPALEPVVEDHARDLPALAGARAVAQEPAPAKPHRVVRSVGCSREIVESLVHAPDAGEMARMSLAGADDAFELG